MFMTFDSIKPDIRICQINRVRLVVFMHVKLDTRMKQLITRICFSKLISPRYLYNSRCISQKTDNYDDYYRRNTKTYTKSLLVGFGVASLITYQIYEKRKAKVLLERVGDVNFGGDFKDGLPNYTLDQVTKHCSKENRIWVSYKQGVYDITDFVAEHPGGDQIMLAAGSSIEPFWLLYNVHRTSEILTMLESMRIGNLSAEDASHAIKDMTDPYCNDPKRHNVLKPASVKPYNAEPPSSLLIENYLTPNEFFYVRNHLPVPEVDPKTYELEIEVEGKKGTKVLTLDDIKKLPRYSINVTIMCAGNRRSEMSKVKAVKGLEWGAASVGNAKWTGARLVDVLGLVGINDDVKGYNHVQFEGLDTDPTNKPYGASIPFNKALDKRGDVILAYEMNDQPLPNDHGFPVRVVVPGTVGARNVKWLGKIIVSSKESDSHWQQNDYKGFSPSTDWNNVDWDKSPAIQVLPVISAICKPSNNEVVKVEDGHITVKGYAWSGGGQQIIRVDVTPDGGKNWYVAEFDYQDSNIPPQHWSWTLWTAKIPIATGTETIEIWAKAVDSSYNTQPESFENIWNLRGVLNNAYHRIKVNLKW